MESAAANPPRNGEGVQAKPGGGAEGRARHRTVGAPADTVRRARQLRRNMSLPEVLLWQQLRQGPGGFKFRKQCPQECYSLDFACLEARLCIEVDGEAHDRGDRPERDEKRDRRLFALGFETMRIPAREVLGNMEGVLTGIVARCQALRPLHRPSDGPPPRSGEDLA